jgi:hypothetical protein
VKIIAYQIVGDRYSDFVEVEVMRLIGEGWQPLGGASVATETETQYGETIQAMVKYE